MPDDVKRECDNLFLSVRERAVWGATDGQGGGGGEVASEPRNVLSEAGWRQIAPLKTNHRDLRMRAGRGSRVCHG